LFSVGFPPSVINIFSTVSSSPSVIRITSLFCVEIPLFNCSLFNLFFSFFCDGLFFCSCCSFYT
jgi:hypothetical protein